MKLANATAAPPMTRPVADKTLADVITRARALNQQHCELAYGVTQLLIFGSYLTGVRSLNDLDVAVEWRPRYSDDGKQRAYEAARADAARAAGRRFPNFVAELFFAQHEGRLFLKGRRPRISLHEMASEHDFVLSVPHRVVYCFPSGGGGETSPIADEHCGNVGSIE